MLTAHPKMPETDAPLHPGSVWIDLLDPTDDEARMVAQTTGLHVPTRAELSEIESSSRLQRKRGALYLSMPTAMPSEPAPVGFVLSPERLITVRFARLPSFEAVAESCRVDPATAGGSVEVFLSLMENVVDRMADGLEREGAILDSASQRIFHPKRKLRHRPAKMDRKLRALLREIGGAGDQLSRVDETLLGVGRITQFVVTSAGEWIRAEQRVRFETLRADIGSLADYERRQSDKVQFLLDATLGLINIEQNNIIKVLTIVSIVGIPPTFVASMYGMNFHEMPELSWAYGYPYALALMAVSAVAPLVWFRLRGWL